jgi:phosphoribosyl 1,2-cyclic phosphodiesterase
VLVDAGLSGRETQRRFDSLKLDLAGVHGVLVTHEHDDHGVALRVLQKRFGLAVYANGGTVDALARNPRLREVSWQIFTTGSPFDVQDLRVEPFSVPHDSYDPVGFVLSDGTSRVGVVTDMGMSTALVTERLRGCHAIVLECNHDEEMLRNAARPWALKQRILGRQGHLSNTQAADLLTEVAGPALRVVFLAHLSEDCNRPEVAFETVRRALAAAGQAHVAIKLTYRDRPSEMVEV